MSEEVETTIENKRLTNSERQLMTNVLHCNEKLLDILLEQDAKLAELEDKSPIRQHETLGVYNSKVRKLIETATIARRHLINIIVEDKLYPQIKSCIDKMDRDLKKKK